MKNRKEKYEPLTISRLMPHSKDLYPPGPFKDRTNKNI